MLSRLFLRFILFTKTSVKDSLDYCKDKEICKKNKDLVAKKVLSLSDYKIPEKANTVSIFSELYDKLKLLNKNPNKTLKVDKRTADELKGKISSELRAFLLFNDVSVPYTTKETKEIFESL